MSFVGEFMQTILEQVIENIFLSDCDEIIKNPITNNVKSTVLEVERKLSETSAVSSGFEELSNKTLSENVEMRTSTPENEKFKSYEEFLNDTIDEAINKLDFEEKFKEASIQTSPLGVNRECQCDLIFEISQDSNKKLKTEDSMACDYFNRPGEMVATAKTENINSEGPKVFQKTFSIPKQTSRIRVGLSKRARFQPLHTKLII